MLYSTGNYIGIAWSENAGLVPDCHLELALHHDPGLFVGVRVERHYRPRPNLDQAHRDLVSPHRAKYDAWRHLFAGDLRRVTK